MLLNAGSPGRCVFFTYWGFIVLVWYKVVGGSFPGGSLPTPSSLPPGGEHPGFLEWGVCREVSPSQVKCQGSSSSRSSSGPRGTSPQPAGPHIPPWGPISCSPWGPQTSKMGGLVGTDVPRHEYQTTEAHCQGASFDQAHFRHWQRGQHRKLAHPISIKWLS